MPARTPKGRNVASGPRQDAASATDEHQRAKAFLTAAELAALLEAAKAGRHGTRDQDRSILRVHRLKGGLSVQQPIAGDELRAIRRYLAMRQGDLRWLFLSGRGQPLTRQAVSYPVSLAARRVGLPGRQAHTMLHSCGYDLANKGHDLRLIQGYLGHRDPKHAVRYIRTEGLRFEGLWG